MLKPNCTASFENTKLVKCDPCRHFYFSRTEAIKLRRGVLLVTLHYDLQTCFLGLGKGNYINTLSLLPGEELEIEIIRRSKFNRELHEATSVETEFEQEFKETTRNKYDVSGEFKYSHKGEAGFKIFGIGAKAESEMSASVKTSYEWFNEIVETTSSSVSRKYDFSIDIKTEVENTFRSLRKIKNPNGCHPVLYLLSQIMKKYKSELHLLRVDYDFQQRIPPFISKNDFLVDYIKPLTLPFNYFLGRKRVDVPDVAGRDFVLDPAIGERRTEINVLPARIKELSPKDLLGRISSAESSAEVKELIDKLKQQDEFKPGVKSSREYCIRTADVHIETRISECSACCQDDCKETEVE